jgi:hypothetical protein
MLLSAYDNILGNLQIRVHRVDILGNVVYMNTSTIGGVSAKPTKIFSNQFLVFTYYKSESGNDTVYITDITTQITNTVVLNHSNCSIAVTPNQQKVVIWSRISRVYIYSADLSFTHLYTFNGSKNAYFDMTG